jgi:hypothetical protein
MTPAVSTRYKIRARLLAKGMTINEWARRRGFAFGTVPKIVGRYKGKPAPPPGTKAREVIDALEMETGVTICSKRLGGEA